MDTKLMRCLEKIRRGAVKEPAFYVLLEEYYCCLGLLLWKMSPVR